MLDLLLAEKSATAASKQLGISRSAVSHALRRLRDLLGDPLLVRTREGLTLSPFATELREPLRRTLDQLESLLDLRKLDPAKQRASFTLAAGEWFARYSIPKLTDELQQQAPGVQLHLAALDPAVLAKRLASGELDLAIGALDPHEPELESVVFAHDRMVGVVRHGHPFARSAPSPKQYAAATHAVATASPKLMREVVDELHKWSARVAVTLPYPFSAPQLVADSDLVVTMPRVLALRLVEENQPVAIIEPPFASPRRTLKMVWHRQSEKLRGQQWLRQRIISLLTILAAKWAVEWNAR